MGAVYGPGRVPIVGASGGVYAILLACAVLFPHVKLLLFFILPISIRVIAVLLFGAMILMVLNSLSYRQLGAQFWSDVAHLGGGAAAAFWLWVLPVIGTKARQGQARLNHGAWERKTRDRLAEQAETDRILDKIRQEGLDSLSDRERERLQEATRKQRQEEHRMRRL
jgi:hypothetical protein